MNGIEIIKLLRDNQLEIRDRFKATIVAVFGSYARGEQSQESDLDVLYRIEDGDHFGLVEIDGLEDFIKELVSVPKIDLVNQRYINPIIQLEIENELMYV